MSDCTFEIKKVLAVLSTTNNYQKRVSLVSWNGKPECLDVRTWSCKDESNPIPLKGITLNQNETTQLMEALKDSGIQEVG